MDHSLVILNSEISAKIETFNMLPLVHTLKAQMVQLSEQSAKRLWRKSADKQFALLNYRTKPIEDVNLSPSQLLMGRRPGNTLPAASDILRPKGQNLDRIK